MTIRVVRDQQAAMRQALRIGSRSIFTDLSYEQGVEAFGRPDDLYDAALGARKALTALLHAKRKNFPVENTEVSVKRHASEERTSGKGDYIFTPR